MPIGDKKGEPMYRQMELNPRAADGEMHSPEQVQMRLEKARQQAEYHEQQRMQLESQRRELEHSNEQKNTFKADLNELGMKLHNAVRRLERELESMEREQLEVERVAEGFKKHLITLASLQPDHWSTESLGERLKEALPKLDLAENDFDEAYSSGHHFCHTQIFLHKPGSDTPPHRFNMTDFKEQFLKGIAFHLPLFVLLLITWLIYLWVTTASA